MYQKIIIVGEVCNSPRYFDNSHRKNPNGEVMANHASFRVEVKESTYDGTRLIRKLFNCAAWGTRADFVNRQIVHGSIVLVEGKLKDRRVKEIKSGKLAWHSELEVDNILHVTAQPEPVDGSDERFFSSDEEVEEDEWPI